MESIERLGDRVRQKAVSVILCYQGVESGIFGEEVVEKVIEMNMEREKGGIELLESFKYQVQS